MDLTIIVHAGKTYPYRLIAELRESLVQKVEEAKAKVIGSLDPYRKTF